MDFSQHNKINSVRSTNYSNRQQNFVPQVQSFPNSMHPKFQQHVRNSSFAPCQPSNYQPQNYEQNQFCSSADNRNFLPKMKTKHEPHSYSGMTVPSNSYCGEMMTNMNFLNAPNEEQVSDEEDIDIEYFQCTPSPSTINKPKNPFKHVMQSMQKYSKSKINQDINQKISSNGEVNHQTFFCTHENDNDEETKADPIDQKMYKSHTKIEVIPKGLRITTEILKEDNEGSSLEESSACPDRQTQTDDCQWLNRKVEVTVEEED